MSIKLRFSVLFVLLLSLSSAGYSEPGTIMLDFDARGDVNTETGFTSFLMSDSGTEVNGITIDLAGDINDCRRPYPSASTEIPIYTEQIYRDFIHGISPSGITIILGGLGAYQECDITIYAFDDGSTPRRLADWTANGDYLLTTDFLGGDAYIWPSPWWYPDDDPYEDTGTATADEFGRIVLESSRNSASPVGEDFAFVNALVVAPKGVYVPVPYAWHPVPHDGVEDAPANIILEWKAGVYADKHDVYFGTNETDVTDANRSNPRGVLVSENQSTTTYDPAGFLDLYTTYYWRIDEVNDPNIWKGQVWSFKTLPYFVMDDFDSYEDDSALQSAWKTNGSSAEVSVETAIAADGNSIKYQYKNNLPPYYSEAHADIADLGIDDPDWLGIGTKALVLSFYGDPTNPIDEKMYVKLTDGDSSPHTATVAYSNMEHVRLKQWNKWSIPLTEFVDVNLANVASITIGFGDGSPGSTGTVYFDDAGGSSTSVFPTSLSLAAEANSTDTFTITSNTSWTVSSSQYWLTVSPKSGSNNDTVTVTAEQNGSLSRTATVTVSPTGAPSQTVTVTQSGIGGEGCTIPPMPSFSSLLSNEKFPDPFPFMGGSCMAWTCRRAEIAELVQEFELGYKQETPYSATTGSMDENTLTVTVIDNGETISFPCWISYPSTGSAPYPAMIGVGFSSLNNTELSNMGVAVITFPSDLIAEEINASSRGTGLFYDMYGSDHSAGALMAWAWGMSRLIDALEKTPAANIDPTRLGVTGCSRWGKGALICGAFDERIKLTIPQESGSGGAASWRVSQYQKDVLGQNVQTLSQIVGENCWFRANFSQFGSAVNKLPFDHPTVAALCAPRALLFIENTWQQWLGNLSTWTNGNATHMVWEALGIPDRMGFSQVGHSDHCGFPSSQQPEVTAYVEKFLIGGGTADTNVMYTDGGLTFDEARWVDWTVPNPNPIKGDLYNDCRVGYLDLGLFAERWLDEDCLLRNWWCCEADLNYDGGVDFLDYAELAANWLKGD